MSNDSKPVAFRFDRAPKERHIAVAHQLGVWRPLFPKYQVILPIGEHEEVLERVRLLAMVDPVFREHWRGWNIGTFRYDDQVMFREDGSIIRGGERL